MISAQLTTADGRSLAADVEVPEPHARAAVVLCHPHPRYGGNRFNIVVSALFNELPRHGYATLRFDFRRDGGDGVAERADLTAALDELDRDPRIRGLPHVAVGYSYGASIALGTPDERIARLVAIAPPISLIPATDPGCPTLVLTPRHDQFAAPDVVEPEVSAWHDAEFGVIESADHFLSGHTAAVAARVARWLDECFEPTDPPWETST